MKSFGELAGDMFRSAINKMLNPHYEIYSVEEIRDAIQQITYDRNQLEDERGSDYNGVAVLDMIIAELERELDRRGK